MKAGGIARQRLAAAIIDDLAAAQHISAVSDGKRQRGELLDQHDGHAVIGQLPHGAHQAVDDDGGKPRRAASYMQVLNDAGAEVDWDFAKFIITKFEANDHPQANMTALMRQVFGEDLLLNMVMKSTAVADALTWKQSLYEVQRSRFSTPKTYDRAMESLNAVNDEIEKLLWTAWGRE